MAVNPANLHNAYDGAESNYEHRLLAFAKKDLAALGFTGTIRVGRTTGHISKENRKELLDFINPLPESSLTPPIRELKKYLDPPAPLTGSPKKTFMVSNMRQAEEAKYKIYAEFHDRKNTAESTFRVVMPDGNFYEVRKADLPQVITPLDAYERDVASRPSYEAIRSMSAENIALVISKREDSWTILSRLMTDNPELGMSVFHNITPQSQQNFVTWLVDNKKSNICNAMLKHYESELAQSNMTAMHNIGTFLGFIDKADRGFALSQFESLTPATQKAILDEYYAKAWTFQVYGMHPLLNDSSLFYAILFAKRLPDANKLIEHHKEMIRVAPELSWSKEFFEITLPGQKVTATPGVKPGT